MKNCGNKIKNTCSEKNYATCIYYELEVPTISSLVNEDCITLEETTEDIYGILEEIISGLSTEALGDCTDIVYPTTPGQVLKIKDVILKLEGEICNLKAEVELLKTEAICDKDITHCGLTLPDNACDLPITKLGELLEYLLNQTA